MRILIILATVVVASNAGTLRVPKVFNALITTDDNLTPSQAYPFVQPFGGFAAYPHHPLIVGPAPTFLQQKPTIGTAKASPPKEENEQKTPELELQDETTIGPKDDNKKKGTEEKAVKPNTPVQTQQLAPLNPVHLPGPIYPLDPAFSPYSGWPAAAASPNLFYTPYYQPPPVFIDLSHITPGTSPKLHSNHKHKDPVIPDVPPPPVPKASKDEDETKKYE